MKKIIVTHMFPDLDAIGAVWLLTKFDSDLAEAEIQFVPAGTTLDNKKADSDPSVIHVDTGMGRFDHHDNDEHTCASRLVFEHLCEEELISKKWIDAVDRLTELITQIDHFEDFFWEEADADRYELMLHHLFDSLKLSGQLQDKELVYQGMVLLDAVLYGIWEKVRAEEEIAKGRVFNTKWGKAVALETKMGRVNKLGQKMGFAVVVKKEPVSGFVSVKSQPKKEIDLTEVYEALKEKDKNADWFFHQSRHIILNGSRHNDKVKTSSLSLDELISILTNI